MQNAERISTVLLLNGSPRKEHSTTYAMAKCFADGCCAESGAVLDEVTLADCSIRPCRGCLSCWSRTEGTCVIRDDDVPALKEKVLAADLIIECFPLYFFGMPGQTKLFTDRMLSMLKTYAGQKTPPDGSSVHGFRYEDKTRRFVLISGCAHTDTVDVFDPLRAQFDLICGKGRYTSIFIPQVMTLVELGGQRLERAQSRFFEAGREYVASGRLEEATVSALQRSAFSETVYRTILENVWENRRNGTVPCK